MELRRVGSERVDEDTPLRRIGDSGEVDEDKGVRCAHDS